MYRILSALKSLYHIQSWGEPSPEEICYLLSLKKNPLGAHGVKAFTTWCHGHRKRGCSKTCPTSPQTSRSHFSGPGPCRAVAIRLSTELISISIFGSLLTFMACTPSFIDEWLVFFDPQLLLNAPCPPRRWWHGEIKSWACVSG